MKSGNEKVNKRVKFGQRRQKVVISVSKCTQITIRVHMCLQMVAGGYEWLQLVTKNGNRWLQMALSSHTCGNKFLHLQQVFDNKLLLLVTITDKWS